MEETSGIVGWHTAGYGLYDCNEITWEQRPCRLDGVFFGDELIPDMTAHQAGVSPRSANSGQRVDIWVTVLYTYV